MAKPRAHEKTRAQDKGAKADAMAWLALVDVLGFWGLRPLAPGAKAPGVAEAQPE
jgi:hypothetical protein